MARQSPDRVFVYGTLREGFSNRGRSILTTHGTLLGTATVEGRLYDVGSFPALVTDGPRDQAVTGEVYELVDEPTRALERLDRYEGARGADPGPYRREQVTAQLDDGTELRVWTYVWTRPPTLLDPIPGGDYLDYLDR